MAREDTIERIWKTLFPRQLREFPPDLALVTAVVIVTNVVVFLPWVSDTPIRVALSLPLVLFLPGYALLAALFPEQGGLPTTDGNNDGATESATGIDKMQRVMLSCALSGALVVFLGFLLNFTPWGNQLAQIVASLTMLTGALVLVATKRRWELPRDEQFTVSYRAWVMAVREELIAPDNRTDVALNILLVGGVLLAAGSVGYVATAPEQGEGITEFYLVTERDDGGFVANDYPTNLTVGKRSSLVVGVTNQDLERQAYTVVVELQQVRSRENVTVVRSETELDRFETPVLDHEETWHRQYDVVPHTSGERMRLTFLLYDDAVPADPTIQNAYRETHLMVTVTN